jgi:hypothetical protein
VAREGLRSPCLTIVGEVVKLRKELAWFEGQQAGEPAAAALSTLSTLSA